MIADCIVVGKVPFRARLCITKRVEDPIWLQINMVIRDKVLINAAEIIPPAWNTIQIGVWGAR
jgi:hypothetical protein